MIEPSPEVFLEACGARTPPQLDVEHRERRDVMRWTLSLPFVLIGRDERADLRLDDERVSHRHAYLQMVAGHLWCVDLGSRTGIHGEGGKLVAGVLLPRETFRIGPYALRRADEGSFAGEASSAPANPLCSEADDLSSLPRIALDFSGGAAREKTWLVDRPLTLVGRASFCKVRLHSSMVSRVHCALLNTSRGLWVIDLLGREGTYVNGKAVRWAGLEHNDELQVDQFRIRVRFLAPSQRDLPARRAEGEGSRVESEGENHALLPPPSTHFGGSILPTAATDGLTTIGAEALMLPLFAQFSEMQQQMFDQFQQSLVLMAQMFGGLQREQMQLVRQELDQLHEITRELQEVEGQLSKRAPATMALPRQINKEIRRQGEKETSEDEPARKESVNPPVAASTEVHLWLAQRLATLQQERRTRWQKILGMVSGK